MRYLRRLLVENPAELVWPIVIFLLTVAGGWMVRWLILKALRGWVRRSASRGGAVLIDVLAGPMLIWAVILAAHIAIQSSDLPAALAGRVAEILYFLWMVSVTLMGMRLAGNLDHRSLNIDTFNPIYVLMGHALPEEAQSRPVQRAGDAQAGVHPQVSNRGEAAHPSGSFSFGFAIRPV